MNIIFPKKRVPTTEISLFTISFTFTMRIQHALILHLSKLVYSERQVLSEGSCTSPGEWTVFMSRDNSPGSGEYEMLSHLNGGFCEKSNFGYIYISFWWKKGDFGWIFGKKRDFG